LDLPKKNISPERILFLPPVFDSDKYKALSVQLGTVRLTGVYTVDPMNTLLDTVQETSEDDALLESDNASLKSQTL
jgi:hypothetical protein